MVRHNKALDPQKGQAGMQPPNIIEAADAMDFNALAAAVEANPDCVDDMDWRWQNALHVLVIGGSFRTADMIQYLVKHTRINCHQRDKLGRDPLDLALSLQDDTAAELIAPRWFAESKTIEREQKAARLRPTDPSTPSP